MFFITLSLMLRSFCRAFFRVILAMSRALSWAARFLLGFGITCSEERDKFDVP